MKKYSCYSLVAALMMSLLSCNHWPTQEELANMNLEERWGYLQEGQSLEEVHHLVGEPIRTLQQGNIQLDQYDCALCLTKVSKHNGLLAWNAPVQGFEEEAQLIYIGEQSTNVLDNLVSMLPSGEEVESAGEEMKEALEGLFQEMEKQLSGEKGKEWRESLERNTKEGLQELERFLREDVGDNTEGLLQLQKELLEKNWEEHGEEIIQLLEELQQKLQELEAEKEGPSSTTEIEVPTSRAAQWAAIKIGMTEEEVVAILGVPTSKSYWGGSIIYKYECHLCKVTFNEEGKVWTWSSPDLQEL